MGFPASPGSVQVHFPTRLSCALTAGAGSALLEEGTAPVGAGAEQHSNPFAAPSTLPFQAPRFDIIQDSDYQEVQGTGSVKDGMRAADPLGITCLTVTDDGKGIVKGTTDITCEQPHNVEFIGLYTGPDAAWQTDDKTRQKAEEKGCEGVLSTFLGYGGATPYSNYVGWWAWGYSEDQWKLGDRTERCFAVAMNGGGSANNVKVVGSMRGLKAGKPRRA